MAFPVFLDTCVMYGGALNDVLLELAENGAFRPLWSAHVLEELERNLALRIGADAASSRVDTMRSAFPDAEVQGYDHLIGGMTCDDTDRHVVAAAVRANAEVIVTFNLQDFPPDSVTPYDIAVVHPDDFMLDQLDLYPTLTLRVIEDISSAYEKPAMTAEELLRLLRKAGVPKFAAAVSARI